MEPDPVTVLLRRIEDGDRDAHALLYERVHRELHGRAHRMLEGSPGTLQTTALVHEAWLKLLGGQTPSWIDRAHFLKVAARAMRSVLVDRARAKNAEKREGGHRRIALDDVVAEYDARAVDLVALDEALDRLQTFDPQLSQLVELRFFAGSSVEETAKILGISPSTAERAWRTARTWLRGEV